MTGSTPPGWYDDGHTPDAWRWWDGTQWTDHVHRVDSRAEVQPPWWQRRSTIAVGAGVLALVVVLAGVTRPEADDRVATGPSDATEQSVVEDEFSGLGLTESSTTQTSTTPSTSTTSSTTTSTTTTTTTTTTSTSTTSTSSSSTSTSAATTTTTTAPPSTPAPTTAPPATAASTTTTTQAAQQTCDPNYSGCVPIASDVDCAGGSGNGPAYVQGPVSVIGRDIYGLDSDNDGIGCE